MIIILITLIITRKVSKSRERAKNVSLSTLQLPPTFKSMSSPNQLETYENCLYATVIKIN